MPHPSRINLYRDVLDCTELTGVTGIGLLSFFDEMNETQS